MADVLGIWIALAGAVAVLAGLTGLRRVQRLRRGGVKSWARAVPWPGGADRDNDGEPQVVLQYTLPDGRVLERLVPGPSGSLQPGRSVLIWYDSDDPLDVLVYGRHGRVLDVVFAAVGTLFVLIGVAIAAVGF